MQEPLPASGHFELGAEKGDVPPMPTQTCAPGATVLVAEDDVLIRIAVAEYLRECGFRVIEAAGGLEARTVLQHGPDIHVLFADARLAGDDSGFALAQWVRRHRPAMTTVLAVSLEAKAEAAAKLCAKNQSVPPPLSHLRGRIDGMRRRGPFPRPPRAPRARLRAR